MRHRRHRASPDAATNTSEKSLLEGTFVSPSKKKEETPPLPFHAYPHTYGQPAGPGRKYLWPIAMLIGLAMVVVRTALYNVRSTLQHRNFFISKWSNIGAFENSKMNIEVLNAHSISYLLLTVVPVHFGNELRLGGELSSAHKRWYKKVFEKKRDGARDVRHAASR